MSRWFVIKNTNPRNEVTGDLQSNYPINSAKNQRKNNGRGTLNASFLMREHGNTILLITITAAAAILLNPIAYIDALILGALILFLGHIFLQEKMLLAFLLVRPTLDGWRHTILFQYKEIIINLTSALAILFLAWSLFILFKYKKEIKNIPLKILLPLFSMIMLASAAYSVSPAVSITESIKFINAAAFFWLGYIFIRQKKIKIKELAAAIAVSLIIPIVFAAAQIMSNTGLDTPGVRGRVYGTLGHPNVFAFLMLSLIIMLTEYGIINPDKFWEQKKSLLIISYCALLVLILLTYTRAAIIGLLIFLIIIGAYRYRKMLISLIIGASLFYLIFSPVNDLIIEKTNYNLKNIPVIGRLTDRNEDADSISWRLSLIRETMPIIAAKKYFGYGYGTFKKVWGENKSLTHQWDDSSEAHNDYLRIALELGLTGLLIYLLILLRLIHIIFQKMVKKIERAKNKIKFRTDAKYIHLFAWALIFAIISLSDNMLRHTPVMWLTWSYWGAGLAEAKNPRAPNLLP